MAYFDEGDYASIPDAGMSKARFRFLHCGIHTSAGSIGV